MDPFRKALTEVIRGYEDAQPESLPSWTCLQFLTGFLANQSKKMLAINEGLVSSCFEAYDAYRQLMAEGTAWSETEELKTMQLPPTVPGVPGTTDLTCQCRQEILKILKSLILYSPAREVVYSEFGIDRLTVPLSDPHPLVRAESCSLIASFVNFPDAWTKCAQSPKLYNSICQLLLHDPDSRVIAASIATLAELTKTSRPSLVAIPNRRELDEAVVVKLVNIIATLTRFLNLNEVPNFPISPSDADSCVGKIASGGESDTPCAQLGGEVAATLADTATMILKATSHIMKPDAFPREKVPKRTLAADFAGVPIAGTLSAALAALSNLAHIPPQEVEGSDETKVSEDPTRETRDVIVAAGAISALTPLLRAELSPIRLSAASLVQHLVTVPLGKALAAETSHEDLLVLLCSFVLAPVSMSTPSLGAANLLGATGTGGKAYLGASGTISTATSGLSPAPEPLRRAAATALRAIADHPRARPRVGALLLNDPEAACSVLAAGPHITRIADRFLTPLSDPTAASNSGSATILRLATLRLLELLVRTGSGAEAVWSIPGIVARLNALAQANAATSGTSNTVSQEALSANRCLAGLCQEIRDARAELESVRAKAKEEELRPAREGHILMPGVRPEGVWPM